MPLFLVAQLRRAFASNPRKVTPTARESARLDAAGVKHPILRSYLAWRRGLMLFTLFATFLSSALATWREVTEPDKRPELLLNTVGDSIEAALPTDAADKVEEDEEVDAGEAGRHVQVTINSDDDADDKKPTTLLGQIADFIDLASLYVLQAAALAVLLVWSRWRLSFLIMAGAFAISFVVPLLISLCPWSWWGYVEHAYTLEKEPLEYLRVTAEGVAEGASYLVTLLPTVLSLVPAVQRACVRVKMLLPQAILPGWFLVMASPFYSLFLLVIFVALIQVTSSPLLIGGFLLFLSAPLIYPCMTRFFTRPLTSEGDFRRVRIVQRIVGLMTAAAGGLFLLFLSTQKILGVRLLGLDPAQALIVPLDLAHFGLEVLSRSMFVTALGADLFLRMNLAAWQNERAFTESGGAQNYDQVMREFETMS
ncbi:hypothetical protein Pan44_13800 [Caulifigura coniformis]|uniref:Transmembrane protein n=1 Tax=Caulifigura coniformis TaxID=2527983 RepID=A0A517SB54_9PLAN|nr:hypothetical protein [Caulifigura coniformis]QDT53363.1 hypothetical protein Pan44_13800 [Caulifigura coniformis]